MSDLSHLFRQEVAAAERKGMLIAIDKIRAKSGITEEAETLLRLAAETSQGKPLAEAVEELQREKIKHFTAWMNLCLSNKELMSEFDRLRGTNVSRTGSPITVMIDESTGRFAEDARAFFDFCLDLYRRLPPP